MAGTTNSANVGERPVTPCNASAQTVGAKDSMGSVAALRRLDERTSDEPSPQVSISRPRTTGLEFSSRHTDVKLCPLYPETGRWRRDFLAARATGYDRLPVATNGSFQTVVDLVNSRLPSAFGVDPLRDIRCCAR